MNMLFSIIIPYYYRYEEFFKDCIDSVLKQTFSDFECVVALTKEELPSFLKFCITDNRVTICYSSSVDQSSKRNACLKHCKGDYVVFLDADDMLDKDFLENSKNVINQYKGVDLIAFGYSRVIRELGCRSMSTVFLSNKERCWEHIYSPYCNASVESVAMFDSVWAKVFKLSIINNNGIEFIENLKCAEDAIFVRHYSINVNSLCACSSYKSYYWRNNPSSTMNSINSGFFDIEPFFINLEKVLKNIPQHYSTNFDSYINSIILSRINKALSFSKKGEYYLLDLILKYKKSDYIKKKIKLHYSRGMFYRIVVSCIKYRVFFIFKYLIKTYIDKKRVD